MVLSCICEKIFSHLDEISIHLNTNELPAPRLRIARTPCPRRSPQDIDLTLGACDGTEVGFYFTRHWYGVPNSRKVAEDLNLHRETLSQMGTYGPRDNSKRSWA